MSLTQVPIEKVTVDEEFKRLLPKLTDEELVELRKSVEQMGGFLDPIKVWKDEDGRFVIVDGYHRYAVWKGMTYLDPPIVVEILKGRDRDYVKRWIVRNQIGRRNLDARQRALLIAKYYEVEAAKKDLLGETAERVAKKVGVSKRTVYRAVKYKEELEKKLPKHLKPELVPPPISEVIGRKDNKKQSDTPRGSEYADREAHATMGRLVRLADARYKLYGGSAQYQKVLDLLDQLTTAWTEWEKVAPSADPATERRIARRPQNR